MLVSSSSLNHIQSLWKNHFHDFCVCTILENLSNVSIIKVILNFSRFFFYKLLEKLIISQHFHQNSFLSFRIAIEKLAQGNYFKHPLYTFCPEFSDEVVPFVNITPKTSLKKVMLSSLDIVPSDFLVTVTDG